MLLSLLALPQPPNDHLPSTPHPLVVSCRWEMCCCRPSTSHHRIKSTKRLLVSLPLLPPIHVFGAHIRVCYVFLYTQFFLFASLRRLRSVDWRLSMMVYCFIYAISAMSHVGRSSHWTSIFSSGLNPSKSTNKEKKKGKFYSPPLFCNDRRLINNSIIVWKLRTEPSILLCSERTR